MKKTLSLILILSMMFSLIACNNNSKEADSNHTKLAVSVTFNAMAEFAQAVGQDKVDVTTIIPAGTEPHDFEPKAADITGISKASVFIYNGLGMESWVDDAISAAENDNLVVIDSSLHSDPIQNTEEEEIEEHGSYDPHLWLGIKSAQIQVQNIADGLAKADPDNKEFYEKNATEYIGQLEAIYSEYKDKFASIENKSFVTGHAAFHYFCKDFGLTQNSVEDVFAEGEPSTQQLANLVDYCKTNHVTTIFAEDMASPEISQTLANEVGADVQIIHTMESKENDVTYLDRMKDNCEKIYTSLSK